MKNYSRKNHPVGIPLRIASVVLALLMLCSCTAQTVRITKKYSLPESMKITESGTVAQNNTYSMSWNDTFKSVTVTENASGSVWSTIPYDTETNSVDGYAKVNIHSPLTVWYIEGESRLLKSMGAYQGAVNKDTVSCEAIENGLRVTYYFDALSIAIPVEYVLEEDGFTARIPTKDIEEKDNKVYTVSLLPFFVAAQNNKDSYLFVPSGSGALIYTDPETKKLGTYSESVYGEDAVTTVYAQVSKDYGVKLPVYGVKDAARGKAAFAVITSGAESAKIEAQAADRDIGYSSAYATFSFRGYDYVTITDIGGKGENVEKYSESVANSEYFAVKYFLISNTEKADYNGMAEIYRQYLEGVGMLEKTGQKSDYYLNILGGARVKKMFLGIPYYTTYSATTLEDALGITEEVIAGSGSNPIIQLKGYGDYGVDIGKIAGGYSVSGKFGSKKDLKALLSFAESKALDLYMDFDVIRFSRSSGDCSTSDAAATANLTSGASGYYDAASNIVREDYPEYGFVNRAKLGSIVNKLTEKAEKLSLNGIGLGTLSSIAYSDYSEDKYTVKSHMAEDVYKMLAEVDKAGYKTAVAMANAYAAGNADCILGTPENSSDYDCIDAEIPFYQMVFKGSVPIYSSEINLSSNSRRSFLQALKTGQGLGFSVCTRYNADMITTANSAFAGSVWEDIKADIFSMVKEASEYLSEVRNEQVVRYSIISDTLSCTEFSNGTVIYINLGQKTEETPLGTVEAMDFVYGKE